MLVLDQLDQAGDVIPDDIASLLKYLALESRRTEGCSVIVSTSSLKNAAAIVKLNGNDKIRFAGTSQVFKWESNLTNA